MTETKTCKGCGKIFDRPLDLVQSRWIKLKYCTRECAVMSINNARKGRTNAEIYGDQKAKEIFEKAVKAHIPSKETKEKISNTLKGHKPWNDGLTIQTDSRLGYSWIRGLTTETDQRVANLQLKHSATLKEQYANGKEHPRGMLGKVSTKKGFTKREFPNLVGNIQPRTKETLEKSSISHIIYYENHPEEREKNRIRLLSVIVPKQNTGIERKIKKQLGDINEEFIAPNPYILGRPDVYLPKRNLLLFADGCYIHHCHQCNLVPDNDKPKNIRARSNYHKDYFIQKILEEQGFNVLHILAHQINKKDFDILLYIQKYPILDLEVVDKKLIKV